MSIHDKKMDEFLNSLVKKGDQMMEDLKFVQNFDFENASEKDLEKFQEFLDKSLVDMEKTKKEVTDVQKKINGLK